MGAPYSPDLRKRVIAAVDEGLEAYSAATHFRVSVSYIYKALARRRATGEETARAAGRGSGQTGGLRQRPSSARDRATRHHTRHSPNCKPGLAEHKTKVSVGCLWKRLHRLGLTLKKSRNTQPSNSAPTSRWPARTGMRFKPR